jgi:hypothetical protein
MYTLAQRRRRYGLHVACVDSTGHTPSRTPQKAHPFSCLLNVGRDADSSHLGEMRLIDREVNAGRAATIRLPDDDVIDSGSQPF